MRLRGPTGKGESGLKGASLDLLVHLPQNQSNCLPYCIVLFAYSSDIIRGAIPHHLSLIRVNLGLQLINLPGVTRVFQSKNLSAGRLSCVTGLSTLLLLVHDCLQPLNHKQHREFGVFWKS